MSRRQECERRGWGEYDRNTSYEKRIMNNVLKGRGGEERVTERQI
jgi:hypothetical protein